jgi:beta-lactamase regulating signal transducer with metallopeptidase domain
MMSTIKLAIEGAIENVWAVRLLLGVTAIWLTGVVASAALCHASAAVRHRVWGLSVLAALSLPAVIRWFPENRLGWVDLSDSTGTAADYGSGLPDSPGAPETAEPAPVQAQTIDSAPRAETPVAGIESTETGSVRPAVPTAGRPQLESNTARSVWLMLWVVPAGAVVLMTLGSIGAAKRLVRNASLICDENCLRSLERLVSTGAFKTRVIVRESGETRSPLCIGVWHPCVILPAGWREWPVVRLEGVLAHELAHILRCDVAWQLVARLACAVYWFHPLAWLAAWRMRTERESACDDCALSAGAPAAEYSRALLEIASQLQAARQAPPAAAVAMTAGRALERRVRSILARNRNRAAVGRNSGRLLAAGAAAVLLVLGSLNPFLSAGGEGKAVQQSDGEPVAANSADQNERGEGRAGTAVESDVRSAEGLSATPKVRFAGQVVDESEHPISGASVEVFLGGDRASAQSAADGHFVIELAKTQAISATIRATEEDGSRQAFWQSDDIKALPANIRLVLRPAREVPVTVVDDRQQPIERALVAAMAFWSLAMDERQSDAAGKATLRVPADCSLQYVLAVKDGIGLDYFAYRPKGEPAKNGYALAPDYREPVTLVLNGARKVTVHVVDNRGTPLEGMMVYAWYFEKPKKGEILNTGFHAFRAKTDEQGHALFRNIPVDNVSAITFNLHGNDDYFAPERGTLKPGTEPHQVDMSVFPRITIRGKVTFADGRPAPGADVLASGDGYIPDGFHSSTRTGGDGRFELRINPNQYYMFGASRDSQVSPAVSRVIVPDRAVDEIRLVLQEGTRVYGRVTTGNDHTPLGERYVYLYLHPAVEHLRLPKSEQLPNPRDDRKAVNPRLVRSMRTDNDGKFEFFAGPGKHYILGPQGVTPPEFVVDGEKEVEVDLHSDRPDRVELAARVVLKADRSQPVQKASVFGIGTPGISSFLSAVTDADGTFKALRAPAEMLLLARSEDGKLAGIIRIQPDDVACEIPVGATAEVRGVLTDSKTGEILTRRQVDYCEQIDSRGMTSSTYFGGSVTTDDEGEFVIRGLVRGWPCDLRMVVERDGGGRPRRWMRAGSVIPENEVVTELGDVPVPPLKIKAP